MVDNETRELGKGRSAHREQAEQFYRELQQRSVALRVGMESSGPLALVRVFVAGVGA